MEWEKGFKNVCASSFQYIPLSSKYVCVGERERGGLYKKQLRERSRREILLTLLNRQTDIC